MLIATGRIDSGDFEPTVNRSYLRYRGSYIQSGAASMSFDEKLHLKNPSLATCDDYAALFSFGHRTPP
jgi:hypothetical protein